MNTAKKLRVGVWALSLLVVAVAFVAWGQGNQWHMARISNYNLFPLFGLLAFSLMWSHYIAAALRTYFNVDKNELKTYFEITSIAVLSCILLHPGLLVWQLFRDGFGLPPTSYLHNYVAPGLEWAALLGSLSFCIFIAYELRRIYSKKQWWKYVQYASDIAMVLVLIHALALGRQLRPGWFRVVWWIYGLSLLAALIYKRRAEAYHKQKGEM